MKPLEGLIVLDLTRWQAGSYTTLVLADLGATVVKIERPPTGDMARASTRFVDRGIDANFIAFNRGKLSSLIDWSTETGRAAVRALARRADVLVENFRPGVAADLGLGYEELASLNERLIYCSVSGFGQTGPYRDRPAYDNIVQAMGGGMSMTGERGGTPQLMGITVGDLGASLFAGIAVLAAVHQRWHTQRGQWLDVSLLDAQVSMLSCFLQFFLSCGHVSEPRGDADPLAAATAALRTADGFVYVMALQDNHFEALAQALGRPELAEDERYRRYPDRLRHRTVLNETLAESVRGWASASLLERLWERGVPAGPINTVADLARDPHVRARGMVAETEHPELGRFSVIGSPIRSSAFAPEPPGPPAALGEHTGWVLRELAGYTDAQVAQVLGEGR